MSSMLTPYVTLWTGTVAVLPPSSLGCFFGVGVPLCWVRHFAFLKSTWVVSVLFAAVQMLGTAGIKCVGTFVVYSGASISRESWWWWWGWCESAHLLRGRGSENGCASETGHLWGICRCEFGVG